VVRSFAPCGDLSGLINLLDQELRPPLPATQEVPLGLWTLATAREIL
jgi:hypothetical protein